MGYITGYLRKNRNRRLESQETESPVESAPMNSHDEVFQIDYETWYACLAGWSPIPRHSVGALTLLLTGKDKASKAA